MGTTPIISVSSGQMLSDKLSLFNPALEESKVYKIIKLRIIKIRIKRKLFMTLKWICKIRTSTHFATVFISILSTVLNVEAHAKVPRFF